MLRIDVYSAGAGYRVRIHEHVPNGDDNCCDACEFGEMARVYPKSSDGPAEIRGAVLLGLQEALKGVGHAEFVSMVRSEPTLW